MQDVSRHEEEVKGREARQHLQFILLTTDQLDDVMAALAFLKTVPGVDSHRIVVAGHSFGGQLALLAAERDSTIRAAVTFAGAASSWDNSPELRQLLFRAIRKTNAAIRLTHAENDYSTAPGRALAEELAAGLAEGARITVLIIRNPCANHPLTSLVFYFLSLACDPLEGPPAFGCCWSVAY